MRRLALISVDLILILAATLLAIILRDNLEFTTLSITSILPYGLVSIAVAVPVWLLFGHDRTFWRFSGLNDYVSLVTGCALVVLLSVAVGFITTRQDGVPRSLPVIQFFLMSFLLVGARAFARLRHQWRTTPEPILKPDDDQLAVLLVGIGPLTELYIRCATEFSAKQVRIVGLLGRTLQQNGRLLQHYKVLGTPEDIESVLQELDVHGVTVDRIIVTTKPDRLTASARAALATASVSRTIPVEFFADQFTREPNVTDVSHAASSARTHTAARIHIDVAQVRKNLNKPYWAVKRATDCIVSGSVLFVALPVMALVTLLILTTIGYPAIFWQQRPGRNGRPFRLYKFRTMASAYDAKGNRIPDEQRVTWVGRLLRRTRIDELPQLINIFVGDMSLVEPRPLLPVDQSKDLNARLLVRPGLTGWAQVCGGRVIDQTNKAALDIWYVCNAGFVLDLKILLSTLPMLLKGDTTDATAVRRTWSDLRAWGVCYDTPPEIEAVNHWGAPAASLAPAPAVTWLGATSATMR